MERYQRFGTGHLLGLSWHNVSTVTRMHVQCLINTSTYYRQTVTCWAPDTTKFVDVPMRVVVPPKTAAMDRGMSIFLIGIPDLRHLSRWSGLKDLRIIKSRTK